jgi:hypothetical protein
MSASRGKRSAPTMSAIPSLAELQSMPAAAVKTLAGAHGIAHGTKDECMCAQRNAYSPCNVALLSLFSRECIAVRSAMLVKSAPKDDKKKPKAKGQPNESKSEKIPTKAVPQAVPSVSSIVGKYVVKKCLGGRTVFQILRTVHANHNATQSPTHSCITLCWACADVRKATL